MIDLHESDELAAVRGVASTIATDLLEPSARDAERSSEVPPELWRTVHEVGIAAPVAPGYGGGGVPDPVVHLVAIEALATGDPSIAAAMAMSGATALVIDAVGSDDQKEEHLPRFANYPATRGACALYEGFGRAPSEFTTTISPAGPGWRVRGRKVGVPFAASADPLVVVGRTDAGDLRAVMLPTTAVRVAEPPGQLALNVSRSATMEFDAVVGQESLLAHDPQGLSRILSWLRLIPAALMLGASSRAVDYAADYANGREAFGKPISALQGVSFLLAEAHTRVDAARLEVWDVATRMSTSDPASLERSVTMAVNHAGEVATAVTRDAVQVLGGHGFIEDHPVERWYRAAAALSALDFDPLCTTFAAAL